MTLKEHKSHKKHTDLKRPAAGNFGRNEWAILGAPCDAIKALADKIIGSLSANYFCAYADAAHNDEAAVLPGRLAAGAALEYIDCVDHAQLSYKSPLNPFKMRAAFADADLVLVNGNHHQAKRQVIIIDERKKASLQKRVAQLTNIGLVILAHKETEVFDFVKSAVPNWQDLPVYRLGETDKIIAFFENALVAAKPRLNGLVLAGGKSERMGFDKGAVNWFEKEQRYHMAEILKPFCDEVFISCREDQQGQLDSQYHALADTFTGLGPYGGILSALRESPDKAWLVVACDLPLLTEKTLQHLVDHRRESTIATAYQVTSESFPEPLITIWEPKSYPVLLSFLAQGYSCPRKVLINSNIALLPAPYPEELTNVNTPEEFETVKAMLHQKITV